MQAPNWTPDGRHLIYNRNGKLYRFDLESRTAELLDTGFATNNNNDHVLTFDGSLLGISHHDPETDHQSIIYSLPATGGTPTRVTALGPSYLHGWSPDNRFLIYTAERDGDYEIYRIGADGKDEVRLTDSTGLDDGSEYSPDGKWIYFNSVRSGTMELWRMKPDGNDPEQLTDDKLNNWFPHVSPNGKWIAFLSYGSDVEPGDHPFYKEVYLRLMPADGGEPKTIAYLYGGQGTINVPSWSPDSKRLAFVSNTADE
jgi:Tol biopolymer transport system component